MSAPRILSRLMFSAALLALTTACPKIERKVYTFDLASGTGEVRFINITTDDPTKANNDFMELVTKVINGTKLEEDHPGWTITSKELVANEGRLDGVVKFTFAEPRKVGIYQHDKKSPFIYCVNQKDSETLIATNGQRIDDVLAGCVAWDRKQKTLEVTVKTAEMMGTEKTLLPQYQRWHAGETLELVDNPLSMMGGGGGPGGGLGEAFGASLMGSLGGAMGLKGKVTVGTPKVDGPLEPAQVKDGVNAMVTAAWQLCYGAARVEDSTLAGRGTLTFEIGTDGRTSDAEFGGELKHPEMAECVLKRAKDLKFAKPAKPVSVALPIDFAPE